MTVRTYDVMPLAQGPVGFAKVIEGYADALAAEAADQHTDGEETREVGS